MFSAVGGGSAGAITVTTVSGRGFTPEELAEQALNKILYVGGNCHPVISEQASVFRDQIRVVLINAMYQAIRSNHTTIANQLRAAGYPELVKLLEV